MTKLSPPNGSFESTLRHDDRCKALVHGLSQLAASDLVRLAKHAGAGKDLLLDEMNYDPARGLWCPLAVAVGADLELSAERVSTLTNQGGKRLIVTLGRREDPEFSLNPMHGVKGRFFRTHRRRDFLQALSWVVSSSAEFSR